MLAWYASNPDHGGNPDLSANPPPSSSPHFRPTMQSPGPPYQSTMGSAMNYSERPYENQMFSLQASHCQSNSYPSYQPPSPYRPHPVSPPAHQYGGHQMAHYGPAHHPYGPPPPPSPYGDLYAHRPYAPRQVKWGQAQQEELMQYAPSPPRPPPMMPPPPQATYRQLPPLVSSPHSAWSQGVPSPSPRATPSPLPSRSPASAPFSPPPSVPSPAQQAPPLQHKATPSPPSGSATPAPRPPAMCGSPAAPPHPGGGGNDPLQSLQKMVMLDSEAVESPITRANYEMAASQAAAAAAAAAGGPVGGPPVGPGGRPASYFSVEQLAGGSDPGSPYPTYYNLDQNRLCTPPRTAMSTPTSSTFSSAPDSTSSNSPRSDSRTTTASADSALHVNGDVNHPHAGGVVGNAPNAHPGPPNDPQPPPPQQQQQPPPQVVPPPRPRPDFENFGVPMTNGNHPSDGGPLRDDLGGPVSSDSENKDTQDFLQHLGAVPPLPEPDGTVDLRRKSPPRSPRGRRRVFGHDLACDPMLDPSMDMPPRKPMGMLDDRRNSTLPEFEITNGKPEGGCEDLYPDQSPYTPRPPRYYSPTNRWGKMGPLEDGFMGMQPSKPYPDDCLSMPPKPAKRGRKKKLYENDGIVSEWDMYNADMSVHRPPRSGRGSTRGRRGTRRRGGLVGPMNSYSNNNGEMPPMDMYSTDAMLSMQRHPTNGMGDMGGDKDMQWGTHGGGYHMGPPPSVMGADYSTKDSMSVIKPPPMMDTMDNSSMGMPQSQQQPPNYQSDVSSDDRGGRGPLLFTVNKDGSTVKLQDGNQMGQGQPPPQPSQYYDPVLGTMVPQQPKKKRGRPFGSKNKPKPPGEERQPRRRRKKEVFFGPEGPPPPVIKRRIINGPYVHISGVRNKPLVVSIVNAPPKDENMFWPQHKTHPNSTQSQQNTPLPSFGGLLRQNMGCLPGLYDSLSTDRSWLCSLCCKNSHYRGLGDLFGPYSLDGGRHQYSAPPSPAPPLSEPESEPHEEVELKEEAEQHRGKRKSDLMEQMFRAALMRKAKLANGQKPLEEMSNHDLHYPAALLEEGGVCKEVWVHEACAAWSKGVYLFGHRLRGLEDAVLHAKDKLCSRCKFPGASLSCAKDNCPELYHYLCARDNWCQMDEDTYTIHCPQHKAYPSHCNDPQNS